MESVLKEITDFVNNGLGFLGLKDYSIEAVMGVVTQILLQLVATIILFLIIKKFLWKKITNLIESRQELVNKNLADAKEANALAQEKKLLIEKEYQEAREEIRALVNSAVKEGKEKREVIIKEAKKEAEKRLAQANEQIEKEISDAKKEIKDQVVDIAFVLAEKIVQREIDKNKHDDIIMKLIDEVGIE